MMRLAIQMQAIARLMLSLFNRSPVSNGFKIAWYLSTASTVRVLEEAIMLISASVENLGKVVQWAQQYGDDITNGHTHEKIVYRGVHFSFLMHNSYQQKISDQSDDKERDSPIKKC